MAKRNPNKEISSSDVLNFLDRLYDVVLMAYDTDKDAYVAHDIEWVKKRSDGTPCCTDTRIYQFWQSKAEFSRP